MRIVTAALAGLALCAFANVHAAYPDRPIKMIAPWAAGGDTDNIFRPFAPAFQKALGGATFVIANVGGASGTVGAREAKGSPADGYTLYAVHDYVHSTYYIGISDVNYWDFEPVCLIAATPSIITFTQAGSPEASARSSAGPSSSGRSTCSPCPPSAEATRS